MSYHAIAQKNLNPHIAYRPESIPNEQTHFQALHENMFEISDDPSGSDPAEYLSPEDTEICRRFVHLANGLGWPNAIVTSMDTPHIPKGVSKIPGVSEVLAWHSPVTVAKRGLTKAIFYSRQGTEHKGYVFGRVSVAPGQAVALCDDFKLRSVRGPLDAPKSKGDGWGRLPDIDKLLPLLGPGKTQGVDYTNYFTYPLDELLLAISHISSEHLPQLHS